MSETKSLYHIDETYRHLMNQLEEQEGEITPDIEEALKINDAELVKKGGAYIEMIGRAEAMQLRAKAEIDRINRIKKHYEKLQARLEENLKHAVIHRGGKVDIGLHTLSLRKSEALIINEGAEVPKGFTTQVLTTKTDTAALKKAVKAGEVVVEGIFIEERQNLQIK